MWTSDEGAVLRGMLRLFGTLIHCGGTLEDPYWGRILDRLAHGEPSQRRACTRNWLREQFGKMRNEMKTSGREGQYWRSATSFDDVAGHDLEWLVKTGVLKQGIEVRCANCGSTFWYSVDLFRPATLCLGCGETAELPIEADWHYRLNDMVASAIEVRGTRPLVQALCKLEQESFGMFLPYPCQNLAEVRDGPAVTDVDIVAITKGRFVMGEVKSTPTGFQQSEIDKAVAIAREFRPDELILAAPGREWPPDVEASISTATAELATLGIEVRMLRMPKTPSNEASVEL